MKTRIIFIILFFTSFVSLFIVYKVIAFRIKLLTDEINKELYRGS